MKKHIVIFGAIVFLLGFFPSYAMETSHSILKELESESFKKQFVMELLPKKVVPLHEPLEEHTIVIKKGALTVGKLVFTYDPDSYEACIEELKVKAPYRKNGLGTNLMQKALAMLQEFHCQKAWLLASPEQKNDVLKLVSFYEKFGFQVDADGIKNSHHVHEAGMEKIFPSS